MFTPEGLAEALKHSRRTLKSIRPQATAAGFSRVNAIFDARPATAPQPAFKPVGLSEVFVQRAPRAPGRRLPELSRVQALRRLLYQEWQPPGPEDRKLRISAGFISVVMNLLFFSMLLWLMYWKFVMPPRPEVEESIRVQMIGAGAPEEEGGGAPEKSGDIQVASAQAQSARAAVNAPASEAVAAVDPNELLPESIEATRVPVTQATVPMKTEVSPPIRHVEQPEETQPVVASKQTPTETEYRVPDIKAMPMPKQRPVQLKPEALPEVASLPMPAEAEPEAPRVTMPNARLAATAQAPSAMQAADLSGAVKSLPNPAPSTGNSSGTSETAQNSSASSTTGKQTASANAAPSTVVGNKQGVAANAEGAGASNLPKQGSVPTPVRGDDWGDAKKNVAGTPKGGTRGNGKSNGTGNGATAGVFNTDGSIRLPDQFKARPPDPYKEGSWLKRPGIVVQDTVFNKYWRPPETLLEEWVRRGIKAISIPIPGTNLVLNCQVSLLQLGGGCAPGSGKNGPKDNPAVARPPPDIPFKRELFEDQSALGPPKAAEKPKPANDEWSVPPAAKP